MPFKVDQQAIIEAILKADSLAKNEKVWIMDSNGIESLCVQHLNGITEM
jgi:hypothetical protein